MPDTGCYIMPSIAFSLINVKPAVSVGAAEVGVTKTSANTVKGNLTRWGKNRKVRKCYRSHVDQANGRW